MNKTPCHFPTIHSMPLTESDITSRSSSICEMQRLRKIKKEGWNLVVTWLVVIVGVVCLSSYIIWFVRYYDHVRKGAETTNNTELKLDSAWFISCSVTLAVIIICILAYSIGHTLMEHIRAKWNYFGFLGAQRALLRQTKDGETQLGWAINCTGKPVKIGPQRFPPTGFRFEACTPEKEEQKSLNTTDTGVLCVEQTKPRYTKDQKVLHLLYRDAPASKFHNESSLRWWQSGRELVCLVPEEVLKECEHGRFESHHKTVYCMGVRSKEGEPDLITMVDERYIYQ
jgi:hypothetical protein